jgi:hypothetical protein
VGTLFTLFVVPTVYALVGRRHVADPDAADALPAK